ncbi:hypothetical protein [Nocardia asteroides]|uniref:hypothetical protein n=1 Tax=Nocardia asteroides TaxID=1824 RepID=UPI0033F67288
MSVSRSITRAAVVGTAGILATLSVTAGAAADPVPAPQQPAVSDISDCTNPWYINPVKCLLTSLSAS